MRELGWTVIVVSAADYYDSPHLLVARVANALRKATPSL